MTIKVASLVAALAVVASSACGGSNSPASPSPPAVTPAPDPDSEQTSPVTVAIYESLWIRFFKDGDVANSSLVRSDKNLESLLPKSGRLKVAVTSFDLANAGLRVWVYGLPVADPVRCQTEPACRLVLGPVDLKLGQEVELGDVSRVGNWLTCMSLGGIGNETLTATLRVSITGLKPPQ